MDNRLIMFQNITVAVRAKNVLELAGIRGYVQKTPKLNNKTTCGYSVHVIDDIDKAVVMLKSKGFVILGVAGGSNYDLS